MNKAIADLPLLPSKKNPAWKRHQRPNGESVLQFGETHIDKKTLDQLVAQVKQRYKGRSLSEKAQLLKQLIDEHGKGETSVALQGSGRGQPDYFKNFREYVSKIPKTFDEFVPLSCKKEGDRLLDAGQSTGYNVDAYAVGKTGEYSKFLKQGAGYLVYHQYIQHQDHGEELLARLSKLGISVPYEMATSATSVLWEDEWGEEPEIELQNGAKGKIGRSVQYAIGFHPTNEKEAEKLIDFFDRNAKRGAKDAIPNSWFVQDIRSSFEKKVDAFQKRILNTKEIGERELLVLKKEAIEGFKTQPIWLNRSLSKFIKSLAIFTFAPINRIPFVLTTGARKSVNLNKLTYQNGLLVSQPEPKPHIPFLTRMGVKIGFTITKAVRPGTAKPQHEYIKREGSPGGYKYTYPDDEAKDREIGRVMREEQSRGKTPLVSEEVRERRAKRLKDMRELLAAQNWTDFTRMLKGYGITEGSEAWRLAAEAWKDSLK